MENKKDKNKKQMRQKYWIKRMEDEIEKSYSEYEKLLIREWLNHPLLKENERSIIKDYAKSIKLEHRGLKFLANNVEMCSREDFLELHNKLNERKQKWNHLVSEIIEREYNV